MKSSLIATRQCIALLLCACFLATSASAQIDGQFLANGYSVAPLQAAPAFSEKEVETEARKFLTWLESNGPTLTREQMPGPREHAYYLIGERIKHIYAATQTILPMRRDPVLQALFMHAENLGVLGGSQIFGALKNPGTSGMPVRVQPPRAISLTLDGDLLRMRSELGWSFAVPYYFMIWQAGDQQRTEGRRQSIIFSTGTARDVSAAGRSQATIMFLFSPDGPGALPVELLRGQLLDGAVDPPAALGLRDLKSEHGFNAATKLHTEIASWTDSSGAYLVMYSGMDGTYQANRPHLMDFLRSVRTTTAQQSPRATD
jgi:hypothetical protein